MKLSAARAALFVVDIQERLVPAMPDEAMQRVVKHGQILIQAARVLGLPIVVSQQYPKGLGATIAPIEEALASSGGAATVHRFDKLEFSAARAPGFLALAPKLGRDQWIVCGMETHVCVLQSALELAAAGYETHVVADAASSRRVESHRIALERLRSSGITIVTTEMVVFEWLRRAGTAEFRDLLTLIK